MGGDASLRPLQRQRFFQEAPDSPDDPEPDMTLPDRTWRVFYCRPRAEARAAERLEAAGVETFLPLRATLRQWSDRRKRVLVPLFPGYLFAHVTERERYDALQDEAVVKTVAFGGTPAVVPAAEIALLRALQAAPDALEAVDRAAFPVGAEVVVARGPLAGVRGRVTGHPRAQTLLVEVASIHQTVRVQLPADWALRPAGDAPLIVKNTRSTSRLMRAQMR